MLIAMPTNAALRQPLHAWARTARPPKARPNSAAAEPAITPNGRATVTRAHTPATTERTELSLTAARSRVRISNQLPLMRRAEASGSGDIPHAGPRPLGVTGQHRDAFSLRREWWT